MHAAPKGAKAKGKFKEAEAKAKAKPGAKERTAAKEAEAKAKAKPDAKAKAAALFGAEAKSAITIRVHASMAMCESDSNSDNNSASELSELDSVGSSDLTPSEFGHELQEESDEEVAWVWSLRLTGLEWRMWTRLGNIVYHAEFEHVGDFRAVQYGAWLLHRTAGLDDEQLPAVLDDEWSITRVHHVWASRGKVRIRLRNLLSHCVLRGKRENH